MNAATDAPLDLTKRWDIAIIGTGMSGATLRHAPARMGVNGWQPQHLSGRLATGRCERFLAAVGCGLGASTIQYGAALGRLAPSHCESLQTEVKTFPAWRLSYTDLPLVFEAPESSYGLAERVEGLGEHLPSEWISPSWRPCEKTA